MAKAAAQGVVAAAAASAAEEEEEEEWKLRRSMTRAVEMSRGIVTVMGSVMGRWWLAITRTVRRNGSI